MAQRWGMTLTAAPVLAGSAERRPDHPALVFGFERITYAGLWSATRRYATALRDHGYVPGRPVRPSEAKALVFAAPILTEGTKAAGVPLLTVMVEDGADDDDPPLLDVQRAMITQPNLVMNVSTTMRPDPATRLLLSLAPRRGYSPGFLTPAGTEDVGWLVDVKGRDCHA